MCTSQATQLDPTEKDNLLRWKCCFCKRTGLSKNHCLARYDGALRHFVTTSECHLAEVREQLLHRLRRGQREE